MRRVGDAVGMGRDLAVEDHDLPFGTEAAQVVVGAAVAQAQLEHRARHAAHQSHGVVEAGALRLQPADDAVQAAHGAGAPMR